MQALTVMLLMASATLMAAFGSGALTWSAGLAGALASLGALLCIPRTGEPVTPRKWHGIDKLFLLTMGLLVASVIPLPPALTALHGATRHAQDARAAEAVTEAIRLGLSPAQTPLASFTRNAPGTCRLIVLLCTAFGFAAAAAQLGRSPRRLLLGFFVALGILMAAAGTVSLWWIPQGDTLWWQIPVIHRLPPPVAGFMNRNHYAGFLAVLLPFPVGLAVSAARSGRGLRLTLALAAASVLAAGVVASLSRGAVLACAASATFAVVLVLRRGRLALAALLVTLLAALALALPRMPDSSIRDRFLSLQAPTQTESGQYRLQMWRDTLRVWRAYPLVGGGGFAFRGLYPQHRTTSDSAFASHAENVYVQALADHGLAGVGLAVAWVAVCCAAARRGGREDDDGPMRVAALCSLAAAAAHAAVDSSLYVPLYSATLAALTAAGAGHVDSGSAAPGLPAWRPGRAAVGAAAAGCALFGLVLRNACDADSMAFYRSADAPALCRSLAGAPTSWQAWYYLGREARRTKTPAGRDFGARCLTQAAAYDPNNYRLWLELGELRLFLGDRAGARAAFSRVRELRDWVKTPPVPEDEP